MLQRTDPLAPRPSLLHPPLLLALPLFFSFFFLLSQFAFFLFFNVNPAVRKTTITLALERPSTSLPMSTAPLTFKVAQTPWATDDTKPTFLGHRPFYLFCLLNTIHSSSPFTSPGVEGQNEVIKSTRHFVWRQHKL